jgi:hypothetical protein
MDGVHSFSLPHVKQKQAIPASQNLAGGQCGGGEGKMTRNLTLPLEARQLKKLPPSEV